MPPLPREIRTYPGLTIGRKVHFFSELPSTNDYAAALVCDPANLGVCIVAEHQSAGRGQHGRHWQANAGTSLLLSIILPPARELLRPAELTAWAAVNVAGAIRDLTNVESSIKWPNDVLIGGNKICGILIEQGRGTVVGLGLNLNQTPIDFERAGLPDATSLRMQTNRHYDSTAVLEVLLHRLNDDYERLRSGEHGSLEASWVERIGLIGSAVSAVRIDGTRIEGRLIEMSFVGVAIAQTDGEVTILVPETIRQLTRNESTHGLRS